LKPTISPTLSLFVAQSPYPPISRGTSGNFEATRGGVGQNGVLEHKSGNISETRKDRGKSYYGEPPTAYGFFFPKIGGS